MRQLLVICVYKRRQPFKVFAILIRGQGHLLLLFLLLSEHLRERRHAFTLHRVCKGLLELSLLLLFELLVEGVHLLIHVLLDFKHAHAGFLPTVVLLYLLQFCY
jgi:hypothetical protein